MTGHPTGVLMRDIAAALQRRYRFDKIEVQRIDVRHGYYLVEFLNKQIVKPRTRNIRGPQLCQAYVIDDMTVDRMIVLEHRLN